VSEFLSLPPGETVAGLAAVDAVGGGLALATASGVVKRVTPDYPQTQSEFEVVALCDGDRVVRAVQLDREDTDLVFITSDAQLLRFGAALVRPQGRSAGGMAGVRLSRGASVVWFGAVSPDEGAPVVATVAGAAGALPGTAAGTVKVTPYAEYPAKGRGTGGVRCQRFLRGEDALVLAWAGPSPALGATEAGTPIDLPPPEGRRDGSGTRVSQPLAAVGGTAPLPGHPLPGLAGAAAGRELALSWT
jgi:DNA gyrase subunit A